MALPIPVDSPASSVSPNAMPTLPFMTGSIRRNGGREQSPFGLDPHGIGVRRVSGNHRPCVRRNRQIEFTYQNC